MQIIIDYDRCEANAICMKVCPEVFEVREDDNGRWSFDVELLGRLAAPNGHAGFLEVPLLEWHDVAGSKLSLTDSVRSTFELLTVARRLRRIRRH